MQRVTPEVINKRQLEKLIQSGSFDSLENNRSKLFNNVPKFVELFAGEKNNNNQNLLFDDQEISFDDKNLFFQNLEVWNSSKQLNNELEVVGFYFSDHPLKHFPNKFFEINNIHNYENVINKKELKNIKLAGSLLDIKERSNKDGKKYAFITISEIESQYELSIFSENLSKYRNILKEGNLLILDADIIRNYNENRIVVRKVQLLESVFDILMKKIEIYISLENLNKYKEEIFTKKITKNQDISLFINLNEKLINLSFNNEYFLNSYKILDNLQNAKKLDYSLEIS